ncbi:septum formation family protein [Leifsonia sp. F6_8S_P_1B]|uniref:Septum formation family protein n=1 Tax=Leifsonia williamsii TaxID=3035919 RepID=A0ABT8K6I1_9MICO|nr:septum formation family protein [Leifsonia williamsii]MDN4613055.1 septum formation family protein [Leifsonia williamsii]
MFGRAEESSAADPAVTGGGPTPPDQAAPVAEETAPAAASIPPIDQEGGFEALLRAADQPRVDEEPEEAGGFHWNLTPGVQPVRGAAEAPVSEAAMAVAPEPVAPEPVAPEPTTPTTPTAPGAFEAPSFAASLRMPQPPGAQHEDRPAENAPGEGAATERSAVQPPVDEQPSPATTEDASDDADQRGHGLAALLGLGPAADDTPPKWSVIGDTTGIIPLPRDAVRPRGGAQQPPASDGLTTDMPAGVFVPPFASEPVVPPVAPVPPAVTTPSAPAVPPAFAAHNEPPAAAEPVLPPPPASHIFEPTGGADVPTAQLNTAEIAALLADTGTGSAAGADTASTSAGIAADDAASAPVGSAVADVAPVGVTADAAPSVDALPRPGADATQPVEAASNLQPDDAIAETVDAGPAFEPFAATDIADAGAPDEVATGPGPDAFAPNGEDDEEDGLALLFGDTVSEQETDHGEVAGDHATDVSGGEEPAADSLAVAPLVAAPASGDPGPGSATPATPTEPSGIDAILFPTDDETTTGTDEPDADEPGAYEPGANEPGAAGEGPQAQGTAAAEGVPPLTAPTPVFDFDAPTIAFSTQPDADEAAAPRAEEPPRAAAHAASSLSHSVPPGETQPSRPVAGAGSDTVSATAAGVAARTAAGSPFTATAAAGSGGGAAASATSTTTSGPRGPFDLKEHRLLFAIAGGLAILLVLVGLFALGTRLPSMFGAAAPAVPAASAPSSAKPSATPTPTPTPTPTVTPKPAAPAAAGEQKWDALGGGECIQPFTTPWAETFTVVDCATPHAAQMVWTDVLSADLAAPYPGADALAQQIGALCTAPGVIDLDAGAQYTGLQVQGSFPATDQQWAAGQRSYYCFASRSTGEPLTSSVAGGGPTG